MLILKLKTGKTKEPNIKHLITKSCDVGEQSLFNLWGTGANGKSTFLNVLLLFGDYGWNERLFGDPFLNFFIK